VLISSSRARCSFFSCRVLSSSFPKKEPYICVWDGVLVSQNKSFVCIFWFYVFFHPSGKGLIFCWGLCPGWCNCKLYVFESQPSVCLTYKKFLPNTVFFPHTTSHRAQTDKQRTYQRKLKKQKTNNILGTSTPSPRVPRDSACVAQFQLPASYVRCTTIPAWVLFRFVCCHLGPRRDDCALRFR